MRRFLVMTTAALAVISACGSSSESNSSAPSGEESKSAQQIFDDALNAFDQQQAVHFRTSSTDSSGTSKVDNLTTGDSARATVTDPSGTAVVIVVTGGKAYLSQGGSAFQPLTGDLLSQAQAITLHHTVTCVRKEHGTLSKGQISTVNGKRVIAIVDDGKAPGASPGSVEVALDGTPLPVRIEQTGANTAGGSPECGHSEKGTATSQTTDLDYPQGPVTITPPAV